MINESLSIKIVLLFLVLMLCSNIKKKVYIKLVIVEVYFVKSKYCFC